MPELPPHSEPILIEGPATGMPPTRPTSAEPSLGDLFRNLSEETKHLVQQEVALAKTEAFDKAKKAASHIAKVAAGGFVAYAGFVVTLVGLGTLIGALLSDMELGNEYAWLGLLIVGLLTLVVGAILANSGISGFKNTDFSLERTSRTLSNDAAFVKAEVDEVKRDPGNLGASPSAQL